MTPDFNNAAPQDLDLAVYDTASLAGYQDTLEAAIRLLTRSPLARKIAQDAIAEDYVIVIEDAPASETPEQYKTRERGSVDHEQKIIFLRKEDDVASLALTLVHELAHVRQHVTGNLRADFADAPLTIIRKLVAMEADARAVELAFAMTLYKPHPELLDHIAERGETHGVATLVEKLKAKDNIAVEDAMEARFLLYYHALHMREPRERAALSVIARAGADVIRDEKLFTREIATADLMARLESVSGLSYLSKEKKAADPDAPFYTAVSKESYAALAQIQSCRRENPGLANEADWDAFVYQASDAPPSAPKPAAPPAP